MGPCRIDPFGERAQVGACGANAHLIVARNFVRAVAAGAAEHSDHGREVVEALASGLAVANPEKLNVLAAEYGVAPGDVTAKMASQFGLQNGPLALLRVAMRAALADGWGGSMIATDVQDALFGGPQAIRSRANLGVLEEKQVNLLVHGHEPVLSEMIVAASRDQDLLALARQAGAEGINVAGICLHGE
jgi:carbon-monoxide dehydrogenase catalytic subunit